MGMKVGLSAYDIAGSDLVELARAADGLGFESLWLGAASIRRRPPRHAAGCAVRSSTRRRSSSTRS
jgi:alkanesulfonate monooxygenase SsuD/methylene tetrahydromethanopterin reductase-like flavin-dependent oxidoreductase (luciferase family)